ncbi:MAG: Crp/Fnr family transcriptional regulator [Pseudomonadota bacterium]
MTAADQHYHNDPVLDRLPSALVEGLQLSKHRRSDIGRGRSIIADGRPVTAVFLISEGYAVSKMSIDTGDTQILDILGPGSFAGLSQLDEIGSDFSAIALQDAKAYRIDIDTLQHVCAGDEALSRWLAETLARQTQRTQRHLTALGQLPARGRLAFVMLRILDVAQQMGETALHKTIRLPMTQEEIGNMLGLTNVSISKLMSAFRKEGLIDYGRNRIVVHDAEALSEICGMQLEEIVAMPTREASASAPAPSAQSAR